MGNRSVAEVLIPPSSLPRFYSHAVEQRPEEVDDPRLQREESDEFGGLAEDRPTAASEKDEQEEKRQRGDIGDTRNLTTRDSKTDRAQRSRREIINSVPSATSPPPLLQGSSRGDENREGGVGAGGERRGNGGSSETESQTGALLDVVDAFGRLESMCGDHCAGVNVGDPPRPPLLNPPSPLRHGPPDSSAQPITPFPADPA
ncbi:unnamed protein product [Pleuronectes platessa]|uniref:Uncharacterized protein n=1 Tax=Pleuronectes platessa TaxID=8262 RepID=A0A9N7TXN8_PLEPL|nr:unnamed protein product [Pleuronectes platessa]